MSTSHLFFSDLHLDDSRPGTVSLALDFLETVASAHTHLYILGDFVEYWVGDDHVQPGIAPVFEALGALARKGHSIQFVHGNRDFLLSADYLARFGITLLEESEIVVDLLGERVLLMHGDTLCTDDVDYQAFRRMVRDAAWQDTFLATPLDERLQTVAALRERSQRETADKDTDITDVSQHAVEAVVQRHGVSRLIHGHTHRPGVHRWLQGGTQRERYVLGEGTSSAEVLSVTDQGFNLFCWPDENPAPAR